MISQFERYRILRLKECGVPSYEIARCLRLDKRQVDEVLREGMQMDRNTQWFTPSNVALVGQRRESIENTTTTWTSEPIDDIPFILKVLMGFVCSIMLLIGLFALALI